MNRKRVPRVRSLVHCTEARRGSKLPFKQGKVYVFLGEIPNMPDHCVVADPEGGRIWAGYHTDNFREIPEDEA